MKKILYVSNAQSIHTKRWAEHYRDLGVEVHVASFLNAEIPGVAVHLLPTYGLGRIGYFLAIPALRKLRREITPDVVHAQFVTSYGFLAAFAGMHPLVITAWGSDVLIIPNESRLMRWFASYALKHADAVTTVAQHMNAAVSALGIPLADITPVPFGVDTLLFTPSVFLRSNGEKLRLICTRNYDPTYDVATLIKALGYLVKNGLCLRVDMVGDGPFRAELEAQAARLGLMSCVTFHGQVNHIQLANLLSQSDIFVTPALSDGNNVSLNEAMACGSFPIGTDIPANTQWIEDGVNGLLYPSGDSKALAKCIEQACADVSLRLRASKLNRDIVERRADWRICVSRMDDVYAGVIAREINGV